MTLGDNSTAGKPTSPRRAKVPQQQLGSHCIHYHWGQDRTGHDM